MNIQTYSPQVIKIAKLCHEVNRAYCDAIGDSSQPAWENAEDWIIESACSGVEHHFKNPGISPEESHEAWLAHKEKEGWCYGPTKNPELKQHPCMVPYSQLPVEQRVKDTLFSTIVKTAKHLVF